MGTPALHQTSNSAGITVSANANRFARWGCGPFFSADVFTFQQDTIIRTAGVWSDLWVRIVTNTRDQAGTVASNINGSDGNQSVTIPATTTGFFHDSSNTDSISAGDELTYRIRSNNSVNETTGFALSVLQSVFTATAAEKVYRVSCGLGITYTDGFIPSMGGAEVSVTESPIQLHVPGGTLRNGALYVASNGQPDTSTFTLRVNELDTSLVVSIPAGVTGWFEDVSNSVTVFDRDRVNWKFVLGGALVFFVTEGSAIDLVTTAFFGGGCRSSAGVSLKGSGLPAEEDGVGPHSGFHSQILLSEESKVAAETLLSETWEGIIAVVPTNGQNGTCEWRSRVNGSDGTINITVAAFTTGVFESTGASISLGATDLINIRRLSNASNSDALNYKVHNFFGATSAPPAPDTLLGGIYQLVTGRTKDTYYTAFGPPVVTEDKKIP